MPRIRSIKPEFPQSESMGRVSRDARLCFILLWTVADDSGRLRGNSRMLASLLFPYDDDAPKSIDAWLRELERENCIIRYKVNGDHYIEIRNWLLHQKIDKPSPSKIIPFANVREPSPNPRECSSGDQGSRKGSRKGVDQGEEGRGESCAADAADSDEAKGPPEPEGSPVDPELRDWLAWWNALASEQLVPAGVKADEPSEGVLSGWKRVQRHTKEGRRLRELLSDRDAIEREIRVSKFCRENWFRLEKLFGGKNRDGELILAKLVDGGYRDRNGRSIDDPRGNLERLNAYLEGCDGDDETEAAANGE